MLANDVSDVHASISNLSCVLGSSSIRFVFEVLINKYQDIARLWWVQARKGTHLRGGEVLNCHVVCG